MGPQATCSLWTNLCISFWVDMDKVPPLARSSGPGSAPGTARSGSSSATPRTGGHTARSSDGKGTPRDCERLPLGARPSRGLNTPPISARSAAGLSSTPSSTQGDPISSRSLRGDPYCQDVSGGLHGVAEVSGNGHLPRPAWCNDLSREIEVMRHVILQENVR